MPPPKTETLNWLRLFRSARIGPITFYKLLEQFGTAGAALDALPELAKRGGVKAFKVCPKADAEREMAALDKLGGQFITHADDAYPPLLAHVDDAPPVLAVLGHTHLLKKRTVAVVGARNASLNGKNFARKISADLGYAGLLVASGMARGLDAAAHEGALDSGTVAVLGGGVDVVYPKENGALYQDLVAKGALVSEVPLGTTPQARHFPRRNRIISGLARGVVVVEASLKSGSLITARMALEQGREVFAIPGSPNDPRAVGCNKLIQDGANLAQNAEDILAVLQPILNSPLSERKSLKFNHKSKTSPDDGELEKARTLIKEMLSPAPVTVDEIVRSCQFSPASVSLVLLELELAGRLERHPGNRVSLI